MHAGDRAIGSLDLYSGLAEGLRTSDPDECSAATSTEV
jgi:hypothetical protein